MTCDFRHSGGSYVLGALSPTERSAYERHLADCPGCAATVRDLAGLPGLLARVDPSVLEPDAGIEPEPEALLPALADAVRRERRARTWRTAAASAAAAAVTVGLGSWALTAAGDDPTPVAEPAPSGATPSVPPGQEMLPLGSTPIRANLALEQVLWGTRVDLTCSYPADSEYAPAPTEPYSLVVRTRDGRLQRIATWRPLAGKTMHLTAATADARDDIAWVEMRTADGTPVLRLDS